MKNDTLFLHEEALLLALRDREGTPAFGAWYQQAIGASVLAELLLAGRIRLEGEGRKGKVRVKKRTGLGDEVVDEVLETIAASKKERSAEDWVSRIANLRGLKERVASGLCRRGVLRLDEKKVLGIFTRKVYPELDPDPEAELLERMSRAIFGHGRDVDPRTAVLISIAQRTDILQANFPKKELRARKRRIEEIVNGDAIGAAAASVVEALQAAVFVTCIVPTVIT